MMAPWAIERAKKAQKQQAGLHGWADAGEDDRGREEEEGMSSLLSSSALTCSYNDSFHKAREATSMSSGV